MKFEKRILWVRLSSMGDVVHTLPAITDLAKLGFQVEVLTETAFAELYSAHPAVNRVHTCHLRQLKKHPLKLIAHIWALRQRMIKQQFDVVIDAQGLWKSAIIVWNLAAKVMGGSKDSVREKGVWRLYKKRLQLDITANVIVRYRQLAALCAEQLGVDKAAIHKQKQTAPIFYPRDNLLLDDDENNATKTILILHGVSAFRAHKRLPIAHWQAIVRMAVADNISVLTPWHGLINGEEHCFAKLLEKSGATIMPPMGMTELLGALMRKNYLLPAIHGVISVDSGLGHLSNALGLPTVMLFGATSAERFSSSNNHQQQALSVDFHCAPCGLRVCQRNVETGDKTPPCWQSLTAKHIYNTLQTLMSR